MSEVAFEAVDLDPVTNWSRVRGELVVPIWRLQPNKRRTGYAALYAPNTELQSGTNATQQQKKKTDVVVWLKVTLRLQCRHRFHEIIALGLPQPQSIVRNMKQRRLSARSSSCYNMAWQPNNLLLRDDGGDISQELGDETNKDADTSSEDSKILGPSNSIMEEWLHDLGAEILSLRADVVYKELRRLRRICVNILSWKTPLQSVLAVLFFWSSYFYIDSLPVLLLLFFLWVVFARDVKLRMEEAAKCGSSNFATSFLCFLVRMQKLLKKYDTESVQNIEIAPSATKIEPAPKVFREVPYRVRLLVRLLPLGLKRWIYKIRPVLIYVVWIPFKFAGILNWENRVNTWTFMSLLSLSVAFYFYRGWSVSAGVTVALNLFATMTSFSVFLAGTYILLEQSPLYRIVKGVLLGMETLASRQWFAFILEYDIPQTVVA